MVTTNKPFNRSEFMRLRNFKAKLERDIYMNNYPTKDVPKYTEFLKKDSPLKDKVVNYQVSFQANYKGEYEHFILPVQTFSVIGLKGKKIDIENKTMNMVQTARGKNDDNLFQPNTIDMLDTELKVTATPRGIEEVEPEDSKEKTSIERLGREIDNLSPLLFGRYYVKDLDKTYKFKNKSNRTGEMKLDMSDFL